MSFQWYGRTDEETGTPRELVWEQKITRYRFKVGEEIKGIDRGGNIVVQLPIGSDLRLNKSEAKKYITKGYVEYTASVWDSTASQWQYRKHQITQGVLHKEIEYRELRQLPIDPAEFLTPKKSKKVKP